MSTCKFHDLRIALSEHKEALRLAKDELEIRRAESFNLRAENERLMKALELAVEDVAARFISSNITIADYIDMAKQALGEKRP